MRALALLLAFSFIFSLSAAEIRSNVFSRVEIKVSQGLFKVVEQREDSYLDAKDYLKFWYSSGSYIFMNEKLAKDPITGEKIVTDSYREITCPVYMELTGVGLRLELKVPGYGVEGYRENKQDEAFCDYWTKNVNENLNYKVRVFRDMKDDSLNLN